MRLFAHHLWTCNSFLNTGYTSSFVRFLVVSHLIIHPFHACVKTVIYDELQHRPRGFLLCAWERSGRREEDWMTLSRANWGCSTWGELMQRIVGEGCCNRETKQEEDCALGQKHEFSVNGLWTNAICRRTFCLCL